MPLGLSIGWDRVHVETTQNVDRMPEDLTLPVLQRYEYVIYRFFEGDDVLVARSYNCEPRAVHFLRRESGSNHFCLTLSDTTTPLFLSAVSHLQAIGMSTIEWLNIEGEGYEPLNARCNI